MADGDGRHLLKLAEEVWRASQPATFDGEALRRVQRRTPLYDKSREEHYNLISALHKSVRGSDPDAALYWLARMLEGGEDPLYLGAAAGAHGGGGYRPGRPAGAGDQQCRQGCLRLSGRPEGELALAQACVYLATAPKSNAVYKARPRRGPPRRMAR